MSILRQCETCGAAFYAAPGRVSRGYGKFCTRACQYADHPDIMLPCHFCGTLFMVNYALAQRGTAKYCSHACYASSIPARSIEHVMQSFWARVALCEHRVPCLFCCWLWQGATDVHGYGKISVASHPVHVHRLSWAWHNYPERIPDDYGPVIRHMCHQPSCVNPAHLVSGTQSLNSQDMYLAGRHPNIKLTIKEVQEIRHLRQQGMPHKEIAKYFPVGWQSITAICNRRTWKHVP